MSLTNPIGGLGIRLAPNQSIEADVRHVMSNSFGLQGECFINLSQSRNVELMNTGVFCFQVKRLNMWGWADICIQYYPTCGKSVFENADDILGERLSQLIFEGPEDA